MKKRTAELILQDPEKFAHHDRVFLNNPVVMQGMGLAPLVVVATTGQNSLMLAAAVALLLVPSRVLACLLSRLVPLRDEEPSPAQLQKKLLPRAILYAASAAVVYLAAYPILNLVFGTGLLNLGIYLPMLVVEPLLTYRFGRVQETVHKAVSKGLRITAGYALLLVLLAETMFLYNYTRSYYNSVQQTMYRRFSSVTGQLKMYTGDTAQSAAVSRSLALRRMVEQFADKDKYEFMLLDSYGSVIASSSGTDAEGIVSSRDFEQALGAPDGLGVAVYRTQSGEMVMAACSLVPYDAEDVAALRLVTSLALVERQVKNAVIVSVFIAVAILLFTVMSGLYFVRGIVVPLGQVERTAAGIARGELDVRLPLTGDPHDEVDRLRGTINQMAEGLEETEKMKNEFISSVSHELRTPLTSIRGWVEALMTLDDPTDENYRKGLEIINNETGRLNNMVEELLDFSRLQNGRIRMECRPLDLVAELTDAVLFCEARIRQEGLLLHYTEPEEMIPVYADPDRLRQVFINILDNAIKYSAPGGRITVKLWAGEYKAFVEIIDQGRGIPPEDLENVKTKFYKGSNSVRGSGIGLALVDSIMTALDGTMDIQSTLGRGTVVTLGLPLYHKA